MSNKKVISISISPVLFDCLYVIFDGSGVVDSSNTFLNPVNPENLEDRDCTQLNPVNPASVVIKKKTGTLSSATTYNRDLALIPDVHMKYLVDHKETGFKKVQASKAKKKPPSSTSRNAVLRKSKLIAETGAQLTKAIALAKDLYLSCIRPKELALIGVSPNKHRTVLCFGGHWVFAKDIQGDHAFPESEIYDRLESLSTWSDIQLTPPDFEGKRYLNQLSWLYHFYDAKNIVGLCESCNNAKRTNYYAWLLSNYYYGQDFIDQFFPLNSDMVIPRTKEGGGLGDAMIFFFLNKVGSSIRSIGVMSVSVDEVVGMLSSLTRMNDPDRKTAMADPKVQELIQLFATKFDLKYENKQ